MSLYISLYRHDKHGASNNGTHHCLRPRIWTIYLLPCLFVSLLIMLVCLPCTMHHYGHNIVLSERQVSNWACQFRSSAMTTDIDIMKVTRLCSSPVGWIHDPCTVRPSWALTCRTLQNKQQYGRSDIDRLLALVWEFIWWMHEPNDCSSHIQEFHTHVAQRQGDECSTAPLWKLVARVRFLPLVQTKLFS